MTNTIFTSKEHYLSFRAAWAKSVNDAKRLGKKSPYDFGSIAPEQHMLYNILRGKHPECGFTHITNPNKLQNGSYPNHASYYASMRLVANIAVAKSIVDKKKNDDWMVQRLNNFLEPFEGTITVEMLAGLKVDQIKPIYTNAIEKAA